jgi:putative transposase
VKFRPGAKPRHGSVVERLFGTAQDEFVHNLLGNTQIMSEVRKVTKSVNPKNQAAWTLGPFTEWFTAWGYENYNKRSHWTLKQTPLELFARSLELTGTKRRRIVYDETFRILTMPTTRKQTAKNMVDKGVKVNNIYYWNAALRDRTIEGKQLHVRYDPFNISIAYVQIRGKWVRCRSEQYITFERCTERQLKIITPELRKRNQKLLRARPATAKALANFITEAERVQKGLAERRLMLQRAHDREVKPIFRLIDEGLLHQGEPHANTSLPRASTDDSTDRDKGSSPFEAINYKKLRKLGELR